ncbi:MAG: hypothetical protein DRN95_05065 [Candidatus Hydrothermarchaeota archaeon]|nr:MAG: hypothetical protein DRN95_05065 [Candidatus Hydrothermarchaeota archaeon]
MKKMLILVACLISFGIALCSAQEIKYLSGTYDLSPSNIIETGKPVAANVYLVASEYEPEKAVLKLSIGIDNSIVKIDYDGESKTFVHLESIEIPLPKGIKTINISLSGNAPSVSKLTTINVATVKVYVEYGDYKEDQDVITVPLQVTTTLISQALMEINHAEQKYTIALNLVNGLKAKNIPTAELDLKLKNAKELIDAAKELHDRGNADLAMQNAKSASSILDDVIKDANELKKSYERKETAKKYIPIAIVILLIIALLLRKRRQELG